MSEPDGTVIDSSNDTVGRDSSTSAQTLQEAVQGELVEIARSAIVTFVQRISDGVELRSIVPDARVEKDVRETIASWGIDVPLERLEIPIATGVMVGALSYTHTPLEFQVSMALFSFIIACFDDSIISPEARREFVHRYHFRQPQLHPLLDKLISISLEISEQLSPYSGNTFLAGVLQYGNEDVLYMDQPVLMRELINRDAKQYVEYVRMADGIPAPYITTVWPADQFRDVKEYVQTFPDACDFANITNDLFSFYKESLSGDNGNFIHRYSHVHGKTVQETLGELIERTVARHNTVRDILGEGKARDAWDSFAEGFIQFHIVCPRYRLQSVIPELYLSNSRC